MSQCYQYHSLILTMIALIVFMLKNTIYTNKNSPLAGFVFLLILHFYFK
jgi:hypothetical protein